MPGGPYYVISNIIQYAMQMLVFEYAMESRLEKWKTFLIELATSGIYIWMMVNLPFFTTLRTFIGALFICAVVYLMHKENWYFVLFMTAIVIVVTLIGEAAMMLMIPREMIMSGVLFEKYPLTAYSIYLFVEAFLYMIVALAVRSFRKKYKGMNSRMPWLLFAVFPLSQFIVLAGTFQAYLYDEKSWLPERVIPVLLVCIAADIALIFALRMVSDRTKLRVRNELLEHQMSDQEAYYRGLTASYEEIRKMRHDIDNHLYTMQALIGDGKVSQASDYMKQIIKEDRSALAFPSCGNTVIASYLTRKSEEYMHKQIRFDTDIRLPAYLDISNADLICIYGNILDNAEEAARQTADPHITLLTQYKEPYVTVLCTNTAPEKERRKTRRIPELDRGLGTKIIMNITEKYDGEYTVDEKNGIYRIEIILKNISRE